MKYGNLDLGRIEAIVNKLGGMDGVDCFLRGELVVQKSERLVPTFSRDMRNDGWKLEENVPQSITSISDLTLVSFFKDGESSVKGDVMRKRAIELLGNLGQHDAEFILEHQAEISKDWRNFYLVFPGTLWRHSGGDLGVPCLRWRSGQWCLGFGWLGGDWYSSDRLVRVGK